MEGAFDFLSSLCFIVDTLIPFRALKKKGEILQRSHDSDFQASGAC